MTSEKPKPPAEKKPDSDLISALEDPHTSAFLKAYLAISDDELKAHIRRLVEETRVPPSKAESKKD